MHVKKVGVMKNTYRLVSKFLLRTQVCFTEIQTTFFTFPALRH
jgi:hypothetical protein